MARLPRYESGRAGAKGSRGRQIWDVWLDGAGPSLTYRVTPVLTRHGCFGKYLHRIKKEATARCHHCDASVDSVQHTLEFCPTWALSRRDLIMEIGWDLSPPAILEALLASERGRRAVTSFCEQVMLRKEAAERARVRSSHPERIDRRGRGRRRGRAWTKRSSAAAPPGGGQTLALIDQRLGTAKQSGKGTRLPCMAAPETMHPVRGRSPVCRSLRFPGLFRSQPDGHRGGFSRLESSSTTPLPPRNDLASVRFPPRKKKKKKNDITYMRYNYN